MILGLIAALSAAAAVIAGAFGAHGLQGQAAEWMKTGGQYQLIHALAAVVAIGIARGNTAAVLFIAGGWIFGGTLYAMALGGPRWLGAVTPIGGLALIAGWVALGWALWKR